MRGKILYQREGVGAGQAYYARPFKFVDGQGLHVPSGAQHEEALSSVMGGDQIKIGCTV